MKKLLLIVLAVFMSFGYVSTGLSQSTWSGSPGGEGEVFEIKLGTAKSLPFEGTVLSHDVMCHCVVVKTSSGNLTLQDDFAKFQQDYNRLKGLKIGSTIKGEYKTVDYINYATWVTYK